ncbi:amino acid adenylation domain-containing protein [Streptomyces sp. NPDC001665]
MTDSSSTLFTLIRNADGVLSMWPAARPQPEGWQPAGFEGSREQCVAHADTLAAAHRTPDALPGSPGTLIELFRSTARRHPGRTAVTDGDVRISYAELDERSDRVAAALTAHGAGPDRRVAYHLRRGAPVFVTLLGILKTGAAYVPVDTRYPDARRDLMLTESRPALVVTDPGGRAPLLAGGLDVAVWEYDETAPAGPAPLPDVNAAAPACVLFTSGSSGTPKGVVLEHRNIAHFARNEALPALTPDDRVGHVSSLSFDAFHFETWCAFAAGAEVVVMPTMPDLLGGDVGRELRRRRITAMLVPTMAFNHIVAEDRETFASLRVLHTGGDVVLPDACRQLLKSSFSGVLHNLYGPTEGATACSAHQVTEVSDGNDSVPIGRELAGTTLHVLDESLAPVPDGTPGELHIAGPGVARGYLGRAGLTAERFLPDPSDPGGRMYATGDLVRRDEDGALRYLGRADDQVKIRGYRVEPREVERLLSRHPQLRDVAVRSAGAGSDRHLVALVVPHDELSIKELRAYAQEVMPDYMVPGALIRVAEIPSNDHGKRDTARLAEMVEEHLRHRTRHVPPRDTTETYLAELWSELLAVEEVGVQDDFFALGGNSLLAFRMQRRLVRQLGVEVSARDILATGELGALADIVRARRERPVTA